jgi:hypothetical protein
VEIQNDGRGWLCVLFDEREERKIVDEASEFEDFAERFLLATPQVM